MSVLVSGSLAFDHIMNFPGYFKDHILPEKVHLLNVSFLVDSLMRQRGGTAGNVAYSAALLGLRPRVVAAAGRDAGDYVAALAAGGVDVGGVRVVEDDLTASAFITTDRADNQITGFYPGAMRRAGEQSLRDVAGAGVELAIVCADDPAAMRRFPRECRDLGIPYIYDPAQGLPVLSGDDLVEGLAGARALIGNDYELALIAEKTGLDRAALRERVPLIVTTFGAEGSEFDACGDVARIPAAPPERLVDPTGAGDAYRAGLLLGLTRGFPPALTGRIAAQAATYAVEQIGTQAHHYTAAEFAARFGRSFPDQPPLSPDLIPVGAGAD
ncbi:MAG TPA: carbohydrate kinase family protein [Thermomicrobiales bacterium]|nr:carbohydrate kinase family protein [Thermomicrobiales bacterium]